MSPHGLPLEPERAVSSCSNSALPLYATALGLLCFAPEPVHAPLYLPNNGSLLAALVSTWLKILTST